jgi:hypothetical protein
MKKAAKAKAKQLKAKQQNKNKLCDLIELLQKGAVRANVACQPFFTSAI